MAKQISIKLALVAGGLAVALLLGEVIVRLFASQDLMSSLSWYEAHPSYRFRHRPHLDRTARWFATYHLQTNSRGLRGKHEYHYGPTEKWRVLVHGDSFTFGNGVDEESTFVRRAEHLLHERGQESAELINMGVSAHGTSLEYLYFKEEGVRYQPDVVVIAIFLGNDYLDDFRDGAFRLVDGHLEYQPYQISRLKRMTNNPLYQFVAARSHLLVFLRTRLTHLPGQQEEVNAYVDDSLFEELTGLNRSLLLAFRKEIESAGARSIFLLLPTPGQLLAERGETLEDDYFPQAGRYRETLLRTCEAEGLHCVDVLPALNRAADDVWDLFLRDEDGQYDFHYNAGGHAVVAGVFVRELELFTK